MTEEELRDTIEEVLMVLADGSRWGSPVAAELDRIMDAVQAFNNGKGGAPEGFPPPNPDEWLVRRTPRRYPWMGEGYGQDWWEAKLSDGRTIQDPINGEGRALRLWHDMRVFLAERAQRRQSR